MIRKLIAVAAVIVVVVNLPPNAVAELKPADASRIERVTAARTAEIAKAAERFQKATEDANQKASNAFTLLIQQYTKAGDQATADTLQKQLEELLAAKPDGTDGAATDAATGARPTNLNRAIIAMLGPTLVTADGKKIATNDLGSVPHIMLYFSASWCPPCRKFTPQLVEFFNGNVKDQNVMVVLVGRDRSEADMYAYMKDHAITFPAVPFNRLNASGILQKYGSRGIPNLVLLNPDGTVASGSYVGEKYVGPQKVLADAVSALANNTSGEKPTQTSSAK